MAYAPYVYGQDSTYVKESLFSGSLFASFVKTPYWDIQKQQLETGINPSISLSANLNAGKAYHFTFMGFYYLDQKTSKLMPWLPDYALMITRDKYMPGTFFWGYSNFGSNKFSNSLETQLDVLASGSFYGGYRFGIPDKLMRLIKIDSTSDFITYLQLNYTCRYFNRQGLLTGGAFNGKPILVHAVNYILLKGIYVNFSVFYHLRADIRMPWEPDFAYGFGLANGKPWRVSFSYTNGNNKFPWREEKIQSGFTYGTFTLGFNYKVEHRIRRKSGTMDTQ